MAVAAKDRGNRVVVVVQARAEIDQDGELHPEASIGPALDHITLSVRQFARSLPHSCWSHGADYIGRTQPTQSSGAGAVYIVAISPVSSLTTTSAWLSVPLNCLVSTMLPGSRLLRGNP